MIDKNKSNRVPAAERTLQILELVSKSHSSISVNEVSQKLDLPIASAYRIINLLAEKSYILPDSTNTNRYIPGYKIFELAHNISNSLDVNKVSKPIMIEIANKTGQACTLTVIHDDGIMAIDQISPTRPVSILSSIREKMPININSSGKVLTSFMPKEEQELFLKKAWRFVPSNTEKTITNLEQYRQELTLVKEQKYATDFEEYATGIASIAVPVFDFNGRVISAMGIIGHVSEYNNRNKFNFMLNELIKSGKKLSSILGYTEP